MDFEWYEDKRQTNFAKHRVDLLIAATMFTGEVVTEEDDRFDYGERRLMSIGFVDGDCLVLVYTERDGVTRSISARKGGRRDRRKYQAGIAGRNSSDESQG